MKWNVSEIVHGTPVSPNACSLCKMWTNQDRVCYINGNKYQPKCVVSQGMSKESII